jgi:uncharacterized OB-fold protein
MRTPFLWRDRQQNTQLAAQECDACGYVSFPERRRICKRCGARDEWTEVSLQQQGEVQSYVIQRTLPEEFETPLPFAIVDLPQADSDDREAARVYGLFTETRPEDLDIGIEVEADLRRMFDIDELPVHSFKFTIPRGDR